MAGLAAGGMTRGIVVGIVAAIVLGAFGDIGLPAAPFAAICERTTQSDWGAWAATLQGPAATSPLDVATEWVTRLGACVFDLKFYFCQ